MSKNPFTFEMCLFVVLETIRTSAMRVIHIIVKTEEDAETAHCVCSFLFYLNSNSNKIYHSICQQIDKSGIGSTSQPWIKDMRTAVQNVPKSLSCSRQPKEVRHHISTCMDFASSTRSLSCCRQPISKTKQERSPTTHLSVHGFCIQDHSLFQGLYCCRQPISKTKQNPTAHLPKKNPTAHLPYMDHVKLDQTHRHRRPYCRERT